MILLNQRNQDQAGTTSIARTTWPIDYKMDVLLQQLEYHAREVRPDFVIDRYNEQVIKLLAMYFMRDREFENADRNYSLQKGVLLRGTIGTGKTVLMKVFDCLLSKMKQEETTFLIVPTRTIERDYLEEGSRVILNFGRGSYKRNGDQRIYCFDDLGLESHASKYFGNDVNVMAEILLDRYDLALKTHATTNLAPNAIEEYYGNRIRSRMSEMFNDIILEGPDRRKK